MKKPLSPLKPKVSGERLSRLDSGPRNSLNGISIVPELWVPTDREQIILQTARAFAVPHPYLRSPEFLAPTSASSPSHPMLAQGSELVLLDLFMQRLTSG